MKPRQGARFALATRRKGHRMPAKIPATVITGFLGAGKTTVIRHMLLNADGLRIALIINEFGDLGIDGEILTGCGDATCTAEDITELSNGCICCTVAEDFIPTMQALLARENPPDHIVIETSGLALPQPLVRAFNWPEISTKVTVDSVVTVVDGKAVAEGRFAHDPAAIEVQRARDTMLDHETPLSELFEDQIACADMIVVNKADLMSEVEVETLVGTLQTGARNGVQIVRTSMGALPVAVLLGQGAGAEASVDLRQEIHHRPDAAHDHDEFESLIISRAEISDPAAFAAQVAQTIRDHNILRLKGFAAVKGKPLRLTIQAVGTRIDSYFDRPFSSGEPRETRLVVIGETGLDHAGIRRALSA